jgi:hypothetical protein
MITVSYGDGSDVALQPNHNPAWKDQRRIDVLIDVDLPSKTKSQYS